MPQSRLSPRQVLTHQRCLTSWPRPLRNLHTAAAAVLAALVVVALSGAPVPAWAQPGKAALPQGTYVALGDSYASGFGVSPYAPGTNVSGGNNCQRSTSAYAHLVAQSTGKELTFRACNGARTADFYQANTAWNEPAQLDNLGTGTGLVTFSVGGNDAGFAEVLRDCIDGAELLPFVTCHTKTSITTRVSSALDALRGAGSRQGTYSYDTLMADISSRAPGATVVAVGYPHMFPAQGGVDGLGLLGRCQGVKKADQRWIVTRTDELNAIIRDAAQRHGYHFADPSTSFTGHELCGTSDPWFDGILADGRFHPTREGHEATASDVTAVLEPTEAQGPRSVIDPELVTRADGAPNSRPAGEISVTRSEDQLVLDASASTDADGTVAAVDWYVQRTDGTEDVLQGDPGAQTLVDVAQDEPVEVTAVVADDHGLTDFVTQVVPAVQVSQETSPQDPQEAGQDGARPGQEPSSSQADAGDAGQVVVLGTEDMPVSAVDTTTLTWEGTGTSAEVSQVTDTDGDGLDDLVISLPQDPGSQACLTAQLTDATPTKTCVPLP